MTKATALLFLLLLMIAMAAPNTFAQDDEFLMGNSFYEAKDYPSAIRMYESVLNQNVESAPLYFNLANSYFKSGDLGRAILFYHKARRINPTDPDIEHNLEFASQYSRVQMEGVLLSPIDQFLRSMVQPYRLTILARVTSILFIILIAIQIIRLGVEARSRLLASATIVALALVFVTGAMTGYKYRVDHLERRGVVTADEAPVYSGPSVQSEVELDGAPGLVVEILSESDGFYNVLFENQRRGWIQKDKLAEI